jgi:DNA-binding response OmpR family regulator
MNFDKLKNIKVLLVEDEVELASSLQDAIGEFFHSFTVAINGVDGLEKFKNDKPDIVITDINMPKMNGLEMSKLLRDKNPNLPIIILSAFSQEKYFLSAIDISITKYLIKPFDPDELLDYILSIENKIEKKDILLKDGFIFNPNTSTLYLNNEFIKLTKREVKFISILIECSPLIFSEDNMKTELWEEENVSTERIRTFIKRFRTKTSKNLISNIKGQGYQIMKIL